MSNHSKEMMKGIAELIILQTLEQHEECYGYQLTTLIAKTSDNVFKLKEGTLYPILYRLEGRNLITSERKQSPQGRERRYYQLTTKGKRVLAKETKEAKHIMKGLQQILQSNV